MDPTTVATIFSICLLGGLVGGFTLFVLPRTRQRFIAHVPKVAALVAVSATAGSLYFSEIADFIPCELCWYQRIAMYPLAMILPLALVRRDRDVMNEAFVLAAAGLLASAYHMRVQWFPDSSNSCALDDGCSAKWVEGLGVFTIPQMAATAFFLIIMLSVAFTFEEESGDTLAHADSAAVRG
ncbi:MAG: disulfide bond formation protein B [Ilumatobacter sp.]|uniref:disulfide bond formation protein B n=1 Tax=Ilumatobacter sp. TaxID=1967498 RepID=UPI003298F91E